MVVDEGDEFVQRVGAVGGLGEFLKAFGELASGAAFADDSIDGVVEREIEEGIEEEIEEERVSSL